MLTLVFYIQILRFEKHVNPANIYQLHKREIIVDSL